MIGHGQNVYFDGKMIVVTEGEFCYKYSDYTGYVKGAYYGKKEKIPSWHFPDIFGTLQGFAFDGSKYTHAVFGSASKEPIKIYRVFSPGLGVHELEKLFHFDDHKKWWWKYWEAEGVQWHEGKLYIGISVKSKFGFICNYVKEI